MEESMDPPRHWDEAPSTQSLLEYFHPSSYVDSDNEEENEALRKTLTRELAQTETAEGHDKELFDAQVLSRHNSSVWLASASMDFDRMQRSPSSNRSGSRGGNSGKFGTGKFGRGRGSHHHQHRPAFVLTEADSEDSLESSLKRPKPSLSTLPQEIIVLILQYVASGPYGLADLYRLLSVSDKFYDIGVASLYRHVIFKCPQTFDKFKWSIEATGYGQHVRVLDFSAFTSVGLGRTIRMNMEIEMVIDKTILRVLELCPGLNEFLAAESIDTDLSAPVFDKLFTMPLLSTLDFCGAAEPVFVKGLQQSLLMSSDFPFHNLTKLSLHCCSTIPSAILEKFLSRLSNVTRLDLTHTQTSGQALEALPHTAQLTHLSLSRCVRLSSQGMTRFLTMHPATRSLKWLSLLFEVTKPIPLTPPDFAKIMKNLPKSLKHFDVSGLPSNESTLSLINQDIIRSLAIRHADVSVQWLIEFLRNCPDLRYIDLSGIRTISAWTIQERSLLDANKNIEMYELSQELLGRLKGVHIEDFVINQGHGRRGWLHRIKRQEEHHASEPAIHDSKPAPAFSFSQHAINRLKAARGELENTAPVEHHPHPPPATDPVWRFPSHKINVSEIGIGGVHTPAVFAGEGIYNYYMLNSI